MVDYKLKKNPRTLRLKITVNHEGEVVVTAPVFATRRVIEQFLHENAGWIKSEQAKRPRRPAYQGGPYQLFGHEYTLEFRYDPKLTSGWQILGKQLVYNNSRYLLEPKNDVVLTSNETALLEKFSKNTLRTYISTRLPQLHTKMQLEMPIGRISLKNQSTRWGSCTYQGDLNFNWHLVHYEPAVIDYVLIHELAHFVHRDHSARFWALVAKYDGDYKRHRQILKH